MIRLKNIENIIFHIIFIVILLSLCGQCRKRETNNSIIEEVCANIPCWNQSWKCGQWKSVNGSIERGKSIFIPTPDGSMVYFSSCALCNSSYIRDPVGHRERIILTSKGLKYHCEHKWRAAFNKRSVEDIEPGDILLLVYKKEMYCIKITEIFGNDLSNQRILCQIAQVATEDIRLNKIDLKKLIWRDKEANIAIPISSRLLPFRVELFENGEGERKDRLLHIEYDQYFAGSGGPDTETDEESIHLAIVHKQEIANGNIVDLTKFRFKIWEDGLGNLCDQIVSKEQEYEGRITYWNLHNGEIKDIQSALDNSYLIIIGNDKRVILKHLDLPIEKTIGPFPLRGGLSSIAVSEDGNNILVGGDPFSIRDILKINALSGAYETISLPFNGTIMKICYYNKDECIAYITTAKELIFFNLMTNKLIGSHKIFGGFVLCSSISPDKNFFATISMNGVDGESSEPCQLTIFVQKGDEILSYIFDKCKEIFLGQVIFTKPDCLSLFLQSGEMHKWIFSATENIWELKEKIKIPLGPFSSVERSPDGTIIWLSKVLSVLAINSNSGELLYEYNFDEKVVQPPIRVIRLIANRGTLAVGFENGYVALLKVPERLMTNIKNY